MNISLLKIERLIARFQKIWTNIRGTSGQVYVWNRVDEYYSMWKAVADEIGAEITPLSRDIWEITLNGKRTRILNDKLEYDNPVNLTMAGRKELVYKLLAENGLRVPEYQVFQLQNYKEVISFLHKYPHGCVVKPTDGTSSGQGVTTHIQTERELRKAAILASLYCPNIMIEPMIAGECYRILVLKGEVIHAVCRRGLRLQGNGTASVNELIQAADAGTSINRDCLFTLEAQGLDLTSVPQQDHTFLVKSLPDSRDNRAEVRTVYDADVTSEISTSLREDALRAAEILGCEFVGVDFITMDCAVSLEEGGGFINELNTTPGLHHHCNLDDERFSTVALRVISPLLQ